MYELLQIAIAAYRAGRFDDAVELLVQITDHNAEDHTARLYLAMAFEKSGRVGDAQQLFKRLTECPDQHVRVRAENVLPLIEAKLRRQFQRDKVASRPEGATEDHSDDTASSG